MFNLQVKMAGLFIFMLSVAFGAFTETLALPWSGMLSILLQFVEHDIAIP